MKKKVIIIGAGPAGLFTAIQAKNENNDILILEKNSQAGKKLLMSGSGQCNLTHSGNVEDFLNHYGENEMFMISPLYQFDNKELLDFFRKRGIKFIEDDNGKFFPRSLKAEDILNVLLEECRNKDIEIKYNSAVAKVQYKKENDSFYVSTAENKYQADFLVIAAGGMAYPTTGSSGDGYRFARELGHNIITPEPALTPIYIKNYVFSNLAGVSLQNTDLSLWRENKVIKRWSGDLLFTHKGLSGPAVLNYSRYIKADDIIKIHLLEIENEAELDKILINKINENGNRLIKNVISEFSLPNRLLYSLLKKLEIDENKKAAQITKNERKDIVKVLYSLNLKVDKPASYNQAMVTKGGIDLKEINPANMESTLKANLFAVGEVLDIDGDTGGYNLQAAFSTAYAAGKDIKKRA
jgi:hypothetical protein